MQNVLFLHPLVFFSNLYENYKSNQNELKRKKIEFIYSKIFAYYYKIEKIAAQSTRVFSSVDIPECIYNKNIEQRAREIALNKILKIIEKNEIDKVYSIVKSQWLKNFRKLRK